jgi:hypothetical protein
MVMDVHTYTDLLQRPELLKSEQVSDLRSIIKEYPFFQSARALYLKGLKNQDSFRYNNELKVTAAYTTDRAILFDFITSAQFQSKDTIHQQISQKIQSEEVEVIDEVVVEKKETHSQTQDFSSEKEETVPTVEEKLDLGKPIGFTASETHSFNEWLQLASQKPIVRTKKPSAEKIPEKKSVDKFQIIDKFIENNPKIVPIEKGEKVSIELPKEKVDKSLMTETLAKVYLEQKKYSKAIKAYDILSLKYPEKSGFFADQIKKIRILQKNKS